MVAAAEGRLMMRAGRGADNGLVELRLGWGKRVIEGSAIMTWVGRGEKEVRSGRH